MRHWPYGVGSSAGGDALASSLQLLTSGNVITVDASEGTPTLEVAIASASDGDIIVLPEGHTQTVTFATNVNKSVTIVGLGTAADGKPSVQLKNNSAADSLLSLSVSGIQLRNIYFPPNLQANSAVRVVTGVGITGPTLIGCYFECSGFDANAVLLDQTDGGGVYVGCTFISVATSRVSLPAYGMYVSDPYGTLYMKDCVLDDGTCGFSQAAFHINGDITGLHVDGLVLRRGAEFDIGDTTLTKGYIQLASGSGAGRVGF